MVYLGMNRTVVEEDLHRIIDIDLPWQEFQGATVLISGANGFLPAYMVETLMLLNRQWNKRPCRVIGLVRSQQKAAARFALYADRHDFQLMVQDVCAPAVLNERVDFVIHAASQASPKYYGRDPVGTLAANVLGTFHLLSLSRQQRVRGFLFFSSGEVYGQVDSSLMPITEDVFGYLDPAQVRSCYAESKRMGETMAVAWADQYGVPARIVRPFHTYGPGMSLDDGRVFADFVSDVVHDRDIAVKSDGSALRTFCYLADAVQGFFTVLLRGKVGQAYNIGNDQSEMSILDLAYLLVHLFPEKGLRVVCAQEQPVGYLRSPISRHCPDINKARQLGWQPGISPEEGFCRTIRSLV